MSPLIKNLVFALVLAVIGWVGYLIFREDPTLVTQDAELNEAIVDGQNFLMRIQELDQISLEGRVLYDNRFQSLIDLSAQPVPEDAGRENPFSPISLGTSE